MKTFIASALLVLSASTFANSCFDEAGRIADASIDLFAIGTENELHCMAVGGRTSLEQIPTISVMPVRYAYVANYRFPCGPAPRSPRVELTLNESCKIVRLNVTGFKLK